jgi:L-alanine-DL-glutamate epimerase-like enolase superfamily enzyme
MLGRAGKTTIVKIDKATLHGKRPRIVGCNSFKGTHGDTLTDPIARLYADSGIIGWGESHVTEEMATLLLGKRLDDVFNMETGTAPGYDGFDIPLWDLTGRVAQKPVHALLGSKGEKFAPIYDGSIYMEDIDPETGKDRGLGPLDEAVQMGLDYGYEAFKMKIGRGKKWMERKKGFQRDIDAIHRVRELIGPDKRLLMDGNNAYTHEEAVDLVKAVRECSIYWFEEPFKEEIAASLDFKRFLHEESPEIFLADGEGTRPYQPEIRAVIRAGAIDVVQFDLRPVPITPWLTILPLIEEVGLLAAPHNWASHLLNYYIPHFGRGISSFCMAETDTSVIREVDTSSYRLINGKLEIPDEPGFGLELDHKAVDGLVKEEGWTIRKNR